jgi:hypothetical protein
MASQEGFCSPVRVVPRDGAFRFRRCGYDCELWHFEAVLDNGYGVLLGVMAYRLGRSGILHTSVRLTKGQETVASISKINLLSDVSFSYEIPTMVIEGFLRIGFDEEQYQKTKHWSYTIAVADPRLSLHLCFLGTTVGWKTRTSHTQWGVMLPKAKVQGNVSHDGKSISVSGSGYHDHNWDQSPIMFLRKIGWFCGNVSTETMKVTWAKILQSSMEGTLLVVLNQDSGHSALEFLRIPSNEVRLSRFGFNPGQSLPSAIHLSFNSRDGSIPVSGDINLKIVQVTYLRFFTIRYCVCLAFSSGSITVGDRTEQVSGLHFFEFPAFWKSKIKQDQ